MTEPTFLTPPGIIKRRNFIHVDVGERYGRGVVIETGLRIPVKGRSAHSTERGVRLLCGCGNEYITSPRRLQNGQTQSCGCLRRDRQLARVMTHGLTNHPLYPTWKAMLKRCHDPSWHNYAEYGGRGIRVCERWHDPFLFIGDIERLLGPRPEGHTLDRADNDRGYEPANVRWATPAEQLANRRPPRRSRSETSREWWSTREPRTEVCERCGSEYQTRSVKRNLRFCSKACKQAQARAEHRYDVEATCHMCGETFTANKHDNIRHCGHHCASKCFHAGDCPH